MITASDGINFSINGKNDIDSFIILANLVRTLQFKRNFFFSQKCFRNNN